MTRIEESRCTVSIAGRVTEAPTGAPIAGALVRIIQGPPDFRAALALYQADPRLHHLRKRLECRYSRADGSYVFSNLPSGIYHLRVSVPHLGKRYGTVEINSVRVWASRDEQGRIKLDPADVALPVTDIRG